MISWFHTGHPLGRQRHNIGSQPLAIGHSALLAAPEELELNVVWVAKGQHRVRGVRWLLDPRVWNAQLIEPIDPLQQLPSITDEKLKMIETVAALAERFAVVRCVTDEAEDETAQGLDQGHVGQASVRSFEFVPRAHTEQIAVPRSTSARIRNGEIDFDLTGDRWHHASLPCVGPPDRELPNR